MLYSSGIPDRSSDAGGVARAALRHKCRRFELCAGRRLCMLCSSGIPDSGSDAGGIIRAALRHSQGVPVTADERKSRAKTCCLRRA